MEKYENHLKRIKIDFIKNKLSYLKREIFLPYHLFVASSLFLSWDRCIVILSQFQTHCLSAVSDHAGLLLHTE